MTIMKNGLLVCKGEYKLKNIGDYIQSLAQEQFYDHIDYFVEREYMNVFFSEEPTRVIMNGWFMWHPTNFPPSNSIVPLFISFHVVPNIAHQLLTPVVVSYLKKHEPIFYLHRHDNYKNIILLKNRYNLHLIQ